jgi:hypothetical protein
MRGKYGGSCKKEKEKEKKEAEDCSLESDEESASHSVLPHDHCCSNACMARGAGTGKGGSKSR